jgi:hypothetical protein
LNVRGVNIVRQTEIQTAEPLVNEPSALDVEMAIEELKRQESRATDQIPSELIKAGSRTVCFKIHKLFICIWNKEELNDQWNELICASIYKRVDKTDCSNYRDST